MDNAGAAVFVDRGILGKVVAKLRDELAASPLRKRLNVVVDSEEEGVLLERAMRSGGFGAKASVALVGDFKKLEAKDVVSVWRKK